jgi:hypothetical protein
MSKLPTSRLPVTPSKNPTAPKSGLRPPQQSSTNTATTTTTTTSSQQVSPTGGDSSNNPLVVGDRVTANGKTGTVAFIGSTKFAEGMIKLNNSSFDKKIILTFRRMGRNYSR